MTLKDNVAKLPFIEPAVANAVSFDISIANQALY